MKKSILATAALLLLGVGIHRLSSPSSPAGSSSTTATPLRTKSSPRAEASSTTIRHRLPSGPRVYDRRRTLADLKRRWLAAGTDVWNYEKHFELARESVELLSCSAELHELSGFLIDHEFNSAGLIFDNDLDELFRSPQAGEARELLAAAIASLGPDEQSTKLEEWSNRAARACSEEEFAEFHASLKNSACAQEALMGRNFELVKSDPEAAIRNALQAAKSGLSSATSSDHINYLMGQVSHPENLDYAGLEQLLPPDSGNPDKAKWTSTDNARNMLIYTWGRVDPEAAARYVMEHPERMNPRLLETIILGSNLLEPGQPLRWVSKLPPGPYYDAAAVGVAKHVLHHDEESTREVVLKMTDMKLREDTLNQLEREFQLKRERQAKREELERAEGREPGSSLSPNSTYFH